MLVIAIRKEAYGLKFRRRSYRYMNASFPIKKEQPFKTRSIVDDEFLERLVKCRINEIININASNGERADLDLSEAEAAADQQGLQGRAPVNQPVQGELGDPDHFEPEVLKEGKVKPVEAVIGEVGACDGESPEGGREPLKKFLRRLLEEAVLKLLEVVQSGGLEPVGTWYATPEVVLGEAETAGRAGVGR